MGGRSGQGGFGWEDDGEKKLAQAQVAPSAQALPGMWRRYTALVQGQGAVPGSNVDKSNRTINALQSDKNGIHLRFVSIVADNVALQDLTSGQGLP